MVVSLTAGQLAHSFGPWPSSDTILVFADTTQAQEPDHYPTAQGGMGHRACQALHALPPVSCLPLPSSRQGGTAGTVACLAEISVCSFLLLTHRSPTKNCLTQTGLGWSFSMPQEKARHRVVLTEIGLMATTLTSHGPKQVAMGWHCCSKVPVLRETPNGQSLRDLNICSTCRRRGEVVEWHTMLQLLLRVSLKLWTLYPDSKQFQPCFSLKCSQCSPHPFTFIPYYYFTLQFLL